jgi:hypothetical protein
MDVAATARSALASQRRNDMAEMRQCIGSKTFGIEPHDAPVEAFPVQPSRKDGLGRLCKVHWNQYTTALRRTALERKAAESPTEADSTDITAEGDPVDVRAKKRRPPATRGPALDGGGQSPD